MDEDVREFMHRVLKDIVTLDVTLYFHSHPEAVDSQEGICSRVAHEADRVSQALAALTDAGIIDRVVLGEGRYEVYSLSQDRQIRSLVGRLSSCYHNDPASRAEIVRHIVSTSLAAHHHPQNVTS